MQILVGSLGHETNTFSVLRTHKEDYIKMGILRGQEVLDRNRGTNSPIGMIIDIADQHGITLIPTLTAGGAGPLITKECLEDMVGELVSMIKAHLGEFQGICLGMHGAGCAEGIECMETYTLKAIRDVVGDKMPITAYLDLHGNISDSMCKLANGLFGCKEYPHFDMGEAGARAMNCLLDQLQNGVEVETAHVKLPLLIAPSRCCTYYEPLISIKNHVDEVRDNMGIYDATFFHGFPYADISLLGSSVVTVAKKGTGKAQEAADVIADWIWDRRESLLMDYPTVEEAVSAAIACGEHPVVINEASDNPGGGAPADGTHLLRELIRVNHPRTIFGFLYDPETVEQAHKAGVGALIKACIGGKTDTIHGETIELDDVLVCALSDGEVRRRTSAGDGVPFRMGRAARLRYKNVEIIVGSIAIQTREDRPFLAVGADFSQYDIVALKSTNHFRAFFGENAKRIFTADPPGIHTANFSILPYKNLPRPIYPIDDIKTRK